MKKNIFYITLAFQIFQFFLCDETVFTVKDSCSSTTPSNLKDCSQHSTNSTNCCLLEGILTNTYSRFCSPLPVPSYSGQAYMNYNGQEYKLSCEQKPLFSILQTCGPTKPSGRSDCQSGSTNLVSCCYYKGNQTNGLVINNQELIQDRCVYLGAKFKGKTTWAGLELDCSSTYTKVSLSVTFLFILIAFMF